MATFPSKENDILILAQEIFNGITANPTIYPNPPIGGEAFSTTISSYSVAKQAAIDAQAAAEQAIANKDAALSVLIDEMKTQIRYAENTVGTDDAKLKLIGWGARKAATALAAPGQCRLLEATAQGEGWITLDWKAPADGGKPAAYNVERRQRPEGEWTSVGMALETEITLTAQPRGIEWEFRVIAANKAGASPASNTVMAVL